MANTDRDRDEFYRIPNTGVDDETADTVDNPELSRAKRDTPSAQEQIDPAKASGRDIPTQEAIPEVNPAARDTPGSD